VVSGRVDLFFIDDVSAAPFYQNNRLRPLAVASPERIPSLPNVPSAPEIGVPGFSIRPWFGLYVSAKTPQPVVAQLRELMSRAMKGPVGTANLAKRGLSPLLACGDEMTKLQSDEMQLWKGVMQKSGIEAQ
jgi:tripartite-type tricarboxylate transporter receptor subunit TctC